MAKYRIHNEHYRSLIIGFESSVEYIILFDDCSVLINPLRHVCKGIKKLQLLLQDYK
jgi:hypothetical protein